LRNFIGFPDFQNGILNPDGTQMLDPDQGTRTTARHGQIGSRAEITAFAENDVGLRFDE
jgi:hypothetical protein